MENEGKQPSIRTVRIMSGGVGPFNRCVPISPCPEGTERGGGVWFGIVVDRLIAKNKRRFKRPPIGALSGKQQFTGV
jgi:hypothetical protein